MLATPMGGGGGGGGGGVEGWRGPGRGSEILLISLHLGHLDPVLVQCVSGSVAGKYMVGRGHRLQ